MVVHANAWCHLQSRSFICARHQQRKRVAITSSYKSLYLFYVSSACLLGGKRSETRIGRPLQSPWPYNYSCGCTRQAFPQCWASIMEAFLDGAQWCPNSTMDAGGGTLYVGTSQGSTGLTPNMSFPAGSLLHVNVSGLRQPEVQMTAARRARVV